MSIKKIAIFFTCFLMMIAIECVAQTLKDELESKKRSKEIEQMLQEDKEKLEKSEVAKSRASLAKNGYQIRCEGKISEPSASFQSLIDLDTEKMKIESLFKVIVISGNDLYYEKWDIERREKSPVNKFGSVNIDAKSITFKYPENAENFTSGFARVADYPEWQFELSTGDLYVKKHGYRGRIFLLNRCKQVAWID